MRLNFSETYATRGVHGEITSYVFIDPTQKNYYRVPDRHGFKFAVSFSDASKHDMHYPVVFEDLTTSDGSSLERISYAEVPAPIKRKLVAWLKVQSEPAAGPAGVPANPIADWPKTTGRTSGPARKTGSDRIKEELVEAHPDTTTSGWKRISRTKKMDGIHRGFRYTDTRSVHTIEKPDGTITIMGKGDPA